jgi:ABC-type lipoprotein export system ATPase subunit
MSLIKLKNVIKYYKTSKDNDLQVLKNINLELDIGEFVSIIGESGSGKSTLMNILGCLDRDYVGEYIINSKNIKGFKVKEIDEYRKNNIGFIFQNFNLISHLNVLDNVTIPLMFSNISNKNRNKRAIKILQSLGLKEHIYKRINQLSGGEKQRVAIARALINNPDIILADEPTGSLDSKNAIEILKILKDLSHKGKLVIMVTHSNMVSEISNRIIKIKDGEIIDDYKKNSLIEYKNEVKSNNLDNFRFFPAVFLSLKNIKQKLKRNLLISFAASIGIMSIVTMFSLGSGVKEFINNTVNDKINPLVVEVNKDNESSISEYEIEKLNLIEGVKRTEYLFSLPDAKFYIGDMGYSFDFINSNILENNILYGNMPKDKEILISEAIYENVRDRDIIGKDINIKDKTYKISGVYIDIYERNIMYFNYKDIDNDFKSIPVTLYLVMKNESYGNNVKRQVIDMGYTLSIAEQALDSFNELFDILIYILSGVAAISLFVSSLMILVILYISVLERTKEIGILRAIGARKKDIKKIFITEAFIIGLIAGIIGSVISIIIGMMVNNYIYSLYEVNIEYINLNFIIFGILLSITISVMAGLIPASIAARVDPIKSLKYE